MQKRVARPRRATRRTPAGAALAREVFLRDWTRRTKTLQRLLRQSRRELSADDIHDLRVTTRRLRASLSVLRQCTDARKTRKAQRELRALGRALGPRRTVDIALRDAQAYGMDTTRLRAHRARAHASVQRALKPARIRALLASLRGVEKGIRRAPLERLGPWLQSLEWDVAYRMLQPPRTVQGRHELRIRMKKVRYVLESFGHRSRAMENLQDALGREHDLGVLQSMAGKHPGAARDARAQRTRGTRAMAPALRSAMRHLGALRRELAR